MSARAVIRSIVLECADPAPVATFWSAVLDLPVEQKDDDWWALAWGPGGPRLAFQVVAGYSPPAWPGESGEQQIHLDIEVDDLARSATRVIGLGARQLSDVIAPGDETWQVFADPAGHPFCLVAFP